MATVPRLQRPTVAPTAAPNVQLQNAQTADLLTINARQQQQFGAAASAAGGVMERVRYEATEQANALRVDDALNKAQEQAIRLQHDPAEGYTALKGYDALNRDSGQPLADEFTGRLDTDFSTIAETLGNDRQRQMFQMKANNLRTQFLNGAMQYEGQQQRDYTLSVREATVKNAADALVINTDAENVASQVTRIRSAIEGGIDPDSGVFVPGSAQMQGKSGSWAKEKAAEAVSGAHTAAVEKFMQSGDLNSAMAYRKRYGSDMTATDMLKIDGTLQKNYETMRGAAVGNEIVKSTQSTVNPTDFDRFTNIVGPVDMSKLTGVIMGVESRGRRHGKDGKLLTSPKGAEGEMQVMPGTQTDPGFGVRAADMSGSPQQQADEIARVGRDYLGAMVKRYNGDIAKASAAYNWGPGAVDEAVKKNGAAWLSAAPLETRNYVASVAQKMGDPGAGRPPRPTIEQMQTAARERLGANASPFAVKQAMDTIEQQFNTQTKAIEQRAEEAVAQGYQALQQNGGRWSDLPANLRAQIERQAPEKLDDLRNFGVRISKGDDITDDRLYLRLATNPQAMAQMTDAQFYALRGGLSQSDFQQFTKQRADLKAGKSSDTPGDLNTGAISRVADQRLRGMGMDPTPKDGSAAAQRMGAIRRFIDSSLLDAQRQVGKKFDDAQVQQHIDGLFAKNEQFRSTFLGFQTGGTTGKPMLSMEIGDIPSAQRDQLRKAFKAQGNSNPTDADLLGAYWAARSTPAARDPRTGSF